MNINNDMLYTGSEDRTIKCHDLNEIKRQL